MNMNKKKETYNKIFDTLNDMTFEKDVDDVEEYLKTLGSLCFCDEGIDDGVDDDDCEDEYVMYRSFDLTIKGVGDYDIVLYYGNNTYLFTTFDIR